MVKYIDKCIIKETEFVSKMATIILASSSPRRSQLLEQIGVKFMVDSKEVDENILDLSAEELVKTLSLRKAKAVAEKYQEGIIIGADTVVAVGGQIYGKPKDKDQAREMIKSLSGKYHEVLTAIALVDASGLRKNIQKVVSSKVYFNQLSDEEIERYLSWDEYKDKAGGYGIQGKGAVLVEKIEGCFYNIVGLPLSTLIAAFKEMGVDIYE